MKNHLLELLFYNNSKFPEYHIYEIPKELNSFLSWINICSEKGWKIEVREVLINNLLSKI